jgi:hypothetical protein
MTVLHARKARSLWLLGATLVLAGLVPVVLFVAAALLPAPHGATALEAFPKASPELMARADTFLAKRRIAWRPSPHHPALPFALLGLLVMATGALIAKRQQRALDQARLHRQDALRRAQQYRASERREPSFGAGIAAGAGEQRAA